MTPRPETNLLICHGLLAPRARWHARVVAYGRVAPEPTALAPPLAAGSEGTSTLHDPAVIRLLAHLGDGSVRAESRSRAARALIGSARAAMAAVVPAQRDDIRADPAGPRAGVVSK